VQGEKCVVISVFYMCWLRVNPRHILVRGCYIISKEGLVQLPSMQPPATAHNSSRHSFCEWSSRTQLAVMLRGAEMLLAGNLSSLRVYTIMMGM
jgi:hypothetical protein